MVFADAIFAFLASTGFCALTIPGANANTTEVQRLLTRLFACESSSQKDGNELALALAYNRRYTTSRSRGATATSWALAAAAMVTTETAYLKTAAFGSPLASKYAKRSFSSSSFKYQSSHGHLRDL